MGAGCRVWFFVGFFVDICHFSDCHYHLLVLRCATVWDVRVHVSARLDEGLVARIVARAEVEQRTLTGMLERLLTLGLGTVVTERDGGGIVAESRRTVVDGYRSGSEGDSRTPASMASRSVTAVCGNERFHRVGVFCKTCERVI